MQAETIPQPRLVLLVDDVIKSLSFETVCTMIVNRWSILTPLHSVGHWSVVRAPSQVHWCDCGARDRGLLVSSYVGLLFLWESVIEIT